MHIKNQTSLQFPCDYTFKVFGATATEFVDTVHHLLQIHFPDLNKTSVHVRPSKDNKYLALSIAVIATNKQQLDAAYHDLAQSPLVLIAL